MISDDNAPSPDNDSASPYNLGWLRMDDFITYQVVVLAQMFGREATRTYAEKWGLSLPRYRVLTVLGKLPPVSLLELTTHTQMDKGQISRVVGQLEDDGLLAREADANDGRRQILSLTESGKELFRQTIEVSEIRQNEILSVLTGDELEALKNTLNKLSGHMRVRLDDEKTLAATPDED